MNVFYRLSNLSTRTQLINIQFAKLWTKLILNHIVKLALTMRKKSSKSRNHPILLSCLLLVLALEFSFSSTESSMSESHLFRQNYLFARRKVGLRNFNQCKNCCSVIVMSYLHQFNKIWIQPMGLQEKLAFWLEFYFQSR